MIATRDVPSLMYPCKHSQRQSFPAEETTLGGKNRVRRENQCHPEQRARGGGLRGKDKCLCGSAFTRETCNSPTIPGREWFVNQKLWREMVEPYFELRNTTLSPFCHSEARFLRRRTYEFECAARSLPAAPARVDRRDL